MDYQQYPLSMVHPQYRPAAISQDTMNRDGTVNKAPAGSPAKYPPVHVNNRDQEMQYASLGYVPNGTADRDAYLRAVIGADAPPSHAHVEFPKWVYRADEGGDVSSVLVQSADAEANLSGKWYATPDEARADHDEPASDPQIRRGPGRPPRVQSEMAG